MKRITILFLLIALVTVSKIQAQQGFNYQAVVRNNQGVILTNEPVVIGINLLQGQIDGSSVYTETHNATTNSFGLVTLEIGSINTTQFQNINWSNAPYFIEISVNGAIMGTSQLLSVPYALYSEKAKEAANVFSGDYNDLNNKPDLSNFDANASDDFNGDYNSLINKPDLSDTNLYIKEETDPVFMQSRASGILQGDIDNWNNHFSGDYNDLTNRPTLFSGSYSDLTDRPNLFSGSYLDLSNTPTLFDWNYNSLNNLPTLFSGSYNDLTEKPTIFSGNYNDLANIPNLSDTIFYIKNEADPLFVSSPSFQISSSDISNWNDHLYTSFSGNYNDLSNKPSLFSGSYNDLTDKPSLFSGSYNDLTDKPTIISSENDPVFNSSVAATITVADTTRWGTVNGSQNSPHFIGQVYGGGVVFYVDSTGNHGLVVALESFEAVNFSITINYLIGTDDLIDGQQNTIDIIQSLDANSEPAGYAAQLCDNYTYEGFDDWYLPSIIELQQLFNNFYTIESVLRSHTNATPIGSEFLWSSTEATINYVYGLRWFASSINASKSAYLTAKPIRKF